MGATRGGAEGIGSAAEAQPVKKTETVQKPVTKSAKRKGTKPFHNPNLSVGQLLFSTEKRFHRAEFLDMDPLEFVLRYKDPWDQEIVALVAALLAYGNVKQIRRSVGDVLGRLGSEPAARVRDLGARHDAWDELFSGFVHRFTIGADLAHVFAGVAKVWGLHGSLGRYFLSGPAAPGRDGLAQRMSACFGPFLEGAPVGRERNLRFLLAHPASGAACKRFCMFLRWMGRKDELDPGLWQTGSPLLDGVPGLEPADLVLPLDTHLLRISRDLGLIHSKVATWAAAVEASQALEKWDARDPLRFDFALCRLGMLGYA